MTHTPTPWRVQGERIKAYRIEDRSGSPIAYTNPRLGADEERDNAHFIVEAVNAYAALKHEVAQLRTALTYYADAAVYRPTAPVLPSEAAGLPYILDDEGHLARVALNLANQRKEPAR